MYICIPFLVFGVQSWCYSGRGPTWRCGRCCVVRLTTPLQVGLVTIDEMKRTQERVIAEREKKLVQMEKDKEKEAKDKIKAKERKREKERKKLKTLSFNYEEDEGEEEKGDGDGDSGKRELKAVVEEMKEKKKAADATSPEGEVKKKRFGMNPDVETKFLPDRERDAEENFLREKLRLEWERMQKAVKEEEVDIVYSYWDGSGHKKTVSMRKGNTIYQFLCKVLVSPHPPPFPPGAGPDQERVP